MENLERLLREHHFLQGLSDTQTAFVVSCAKNVLFKAGQFLMKEGQPADTFYLLRKGTVALEIASAGKKPIVMESLLEGEIVGLSWLFPPYRVQLDARAAEPVVALAFDGTCLRQKMEADHELGYGFAMRLLEVAHRRLERVRLQRLDIYKAE